MPILIHHIPASTLYYLHFDYITLGKPIPNWLDKLWEKYITPKGELR